MKLLEKYSIQKTDDIDREKFNLIWDMFYHDGYEKYRRISPDEYWEEFCNTRPYIETSTNKSCFSTYNDDQTSNKPISSELLEIFLLRYSIQVDRINMQERFSIKGELFYFHPNFFIVRERMESSQLFTLLGIENKEKFTKHILGYCPNGEFPRCANYEELKKLFLAMLDYVIDYGNKEETLISKKVKSDEKETISHLFPVGTIVQLSEIGLSHYKSQLNEVENKGSVMEIKKDSSFVYQIRWEGGHENNYEKEDVELYVEKEYTKADLIVENLISGVTYVATSSDLAYCYIFKKDSPQFLRLHSRQISNTSFNTKVYNYRKATPLETNWLEFCKIKQTYIDIEGLFEEACKKYPVGTKFKVAHNPDFITTVESHEKGKEWCVINDSLDDLHINLKTNDGVDSDEASVYTYLHDWAKVVNPELYPILKKVETSMFKKDSHIVYLGDSSDSFIENYCFKQRENYDYLRPYLDCKGNVDNGWGKMRYRRTNWRYATQDEIFAYEQLGEPYDVTTLLQTSDKKVKVDPNVFPKSSYVVLLNTCDGDPRVWGNSIPINYIYQLSKDSNSRCFYMAKDARGDIDNGWGVDEKRTFDSKLELRAATLAEIELYQLHDKPISIFDISKPLSEEEDVQMGYYPLRQCFGKVSSQDRYANGCLNFYNNFFGSSSEGKYELKKNWVIAKQKKKNIVILEPGYYETNYGHFLLRENGVTDFVNGDRKSIFDLSFVTYCRKVKTLGIFDRSYLMSPKYSFLPTPTVMEVVPKENYFPEVREIKL